MLILSRGAQASPARALSLSMSASLGIFLFSLYLSLGYLSIYVRIYPSVHLSHLCLNLSVSLSLSIYMFRTFPLPLPGLPLSPFSMLPVANLLHCLPCLPAHAEPTQCITLPLPDSLCGPVYNAGIRKEIVPFSSRALADALRLRSGKVSQTRLQWSITLCPCGALKNPNKHTHSHKDTHTHTRTHPRTRTRTHSGRTRTARQKAHEIHIMTHLLRTSYSSTILLQVVRMGRA